MGISRGIEWLVNLETGKNRTGVDSEPDMMVPAPRHSPVEPPPSKFQLWETPQVVPQGWKYRTGRLVAGTRLSPGDFSGQAVW